MLCPGAFLLTAGAVTAPAHLSGDLPPGREAQRGWMPPAPWLTVLPRASIFPFPIALCSGVIWQAGSSLSPRIPHSVTGLSPATRCCGGDRGQPSILHTTGALWHWHQELNAGRGISAGPPRPRPQRWADLPSQPSPRDAISWLMLAAGHC